MMITFGLFHLVAYIESGLQSQTLALAILLASLFGGLFGLIYLHTRSLWLPVALHFTWNFVENDVLNVTGQISNPNLIGALTRMQAPLTTTRLGWGNIVLLETLVFAFIALGVMLWLRHSSPVWRQNENG
jgi:membrane protease YdiL (CAAX protease family)